MNLGTRALVGDSDHHGSGAFTIRLLHMSPCLPMSVPTDHNHRTRRQQMMPLNCYRWSQNRPRQVCPSGSFPSRTCPGKQPAPSPFDPEKKAKKPCQPALLFSKTPFQCFPQTPRHAHVVPGIPSRTTHPSRLSMPRPFPAGFAVFRSFCRSVAAWDIAVSMAFATPARFSPDANVAGPTSRQSPISKPPMAVSLTRENRPRDESPKSAHQSWSKMGCPHQTAGNRTPPTRSEPLRIPAPNSNAPKASFLHTLKPGLSASLRAWATSSWTSVFDMLDLVNCRSNLPRPSIEPTRASG